MAAALGPRCRARDGHGQRCGSHAPVGATLCPAHDRLALRRAAKIRAHDPALCRHGLTLLTCGGAHGIGE